ncbi:MFS transporter [Paractinoplanes durhamensis]|uniref:MFS transporter n=1 Tax=Paractinoplanes durhamensis TaxID=113563 RepID=UPI00362EEEAA
MGCGIVVAIPSIPAAIAGFALTGIGVGILVPLAFSAAGEAAPGHSDEVIARVNLFNYGGALVGAVLLGGLSEPIGLRLAFLIPVLGLLATLPAVRALRHLATSPATLPPPATAPADRETPNQFRPCSPHLSAARANGRPGFLDVGASGVGGPGFLDVGPRVCDESLISLKSGPRVGGESPVSLMSGPRVWVGPVFLMSGLGCATRA